MWIFSYRQFVRNYDNGDVGYAGLVKSTNVYNRTTNLWVLSTMGINTVAVSTAPFEGFALGVNDWVIQNDNIRCDKV